MRINNNIMAMNTYRQLSITNSNASKSMEKLSSGLRINRAGDDAAGLSISEKMRAQIRGLTMASKNAQDGISLIQTAEGALNETHSILQRMRELAVQAANDTNEDIDRTAIQDEINQLIDEIDRIANTTEFNTKKLLNGGASGFTATFQVGANKDQKFDLTIEDMTAESLNLKGSVTTPGELEKQVNLAGVDLTINLGSENEDNGQVTIEFAKGAGESATWSGNKLTITLDESKSDYSASDIEGLIQGATASAPIDVTKVSVDGTGTIDVENSMSGSVSVSFNTDSTTTSGIDVSNYTNANAAIDTINNAINTVSSLRSKLGAAQNRLEHTINNLDTAAENLQAAESRIRDVDMAKEMMEFTKNNILQQAATAMLAQANAVPQNVLQLLR